MITPDEPIQQLVAGIHSAPQLMVFEFAGAGSLALWWLHSVAGSSRTVLEATDRYAAPALTDLLGAPPDQAVSAATALAMARQAYLRARRLAPAGTLLGVGCTAAIATDRTRRGAHRAQVAVQQASHGTLYMLTLAKGRRDRSGEEQQVSRLVLQAIAVACGLDCDIVGDLSEDETLSSVTYPGWIEERDG